MRWYLMMWERRLSRETGLASFPLFSVDGFHDTRFEGGVEMMSYLNEDVFALAVILAVEVDDSMSVGTASCKEVKCNSSTSDVNAQTIFSYKPTG